MSMARSESEIGICGHCIHFFSFDPYFPAGEGVCANPISGVTKTVYGWTPIEALQNSGKPLRAEEIQIYPQLSCFQRQVEKPASTHLHTPGVW